MLPIDHSCSDNAIVEVAIIWQMFMWWIGNIEWLKIIVFQIDGIITAHIYRYTQLIRYHGIQIEPNDKKLHYIWTLRSSPILMPIFCWA